MVEAFAYIFLLIMVYFGMYTIAKNSRRNDDKNI